MMKKIFRKIHLWLSVPFGIVITLICFSGAMLVFESEIVELTHSHLYKIERPSPDARPLPLGELAAIVAATLPDDVSVSGVSVSSHPEDAYRVMLSKPKRAAVYINPYTGEIQGRYERPLFFKTMFSLHRWLLGSRPADGGVFWGKIIVGVSTLLLVVILLTGIVIWWPRTKKALRNSLKITLRYGRHRFWYGLHVAGGMYVLLLVLVMALTGLTWSFSWYRTGLYTLLGIEMQAGGKQVAVASHHKAGVSGRRTDKTERSQMDYTCWQQVYERLATANPDYKQITVNTDNTASVSVVRLGNTRGADRYGFNPHTGEITEKTVYAQQSASGKMKGWIYSLHVGSWGGWFTRILYFLAALFAASLPLTGYYLWIRRLFRNRSH